MSPSHRRHTKPLPASHGKRWSLKLTTVLKWIVVLLLLGGLYATSPAKKFVECRGTDVPRYCVD